MDKQPEALRLADDLVFAGRFAHESEDQAARRRVNRNTAAAAELRRLHMQNQELVEVVRQIAVQSIGTDWTPEEAFKFCKETAKAALAKLKEQA